MATKKDSIVIENTDKLGVDELLQPRIKKFNYNTYKHQHEVQVNKHTELDTVGTSTLSEQINMFIARGELDKFMREQELNNIRASINEVSEFTDEEISILNIKHLDRHEVNTAYNRLRLRVLKEVEKFKAQQNVNLTNNQQTQEQSQTVDSKE